ncbi:MAG: hypothetical protein KGJ58_01660 [Patescibacteria group bacterium]|nr:hypothetical protein [Patescibacteria group bacterium]
MIKNYKEKKRKFFRILTAKFHSDEMKPKENRKGSPRENITSFVAQEGSDPYSIWFVVDSEYQREVCDTAYTFKTFFRGLPDSQTFLASVI